MQQALKKKHDRCFGPEKKQRETCPEGNKANVNERGGKKRHRGKGKGDSGNK